MFCSSRENQTFLNHFQHDSEIIQGGPSSVVGFDFPTSFSRLMMMITVTLNNDSSFSEDLLQTKHCAKSFTDDPSNNSGRCVFYSHLGV